MPTPTRATAALPPLYRHLLINIESSLALGGVLLALISPSTYINNLTRSSADTIALDPRTQFIYTQLAGGWLVVVFLEAVVLRYVDDLRVWRLVCAAILCSDLLYVHSLAQAVGGWAAWVAVSHWSASEWVALVTTWPFVAVRLAVVCGECGGEGVKTD